MFIVQFLFWLVILVLAFIFCFMNLGTTLDVWVLPGQTLHSVSLPIVILSVFICGWAAGFFLPILGRFFKKEEYEDFEEEEEEED